MAQTVTLPVHVSKGDRIIVDGVIVLVVRREKWSANRVRITFEECGHGMPEDAVNCRHYDALSDRIEVL